MPPLPVHHRRTSPLLSLLWPVLWQVTTTMSVLQITAIVRNFPELGLLDFHGLNLFIRYASLARESIEFSQKNRLECPTSLPPKILQVLATALGERDTHLTEICSVADVRFGPVLCQNFRTPNLT
jgi:hypothetical protein